MLMIIRKDKQTYEYYITIIIITIQMNSIVIKPNIIIQYSKNPKVLLI